MTRKDFEIIAKILACTKIQDKATINRILKSTNPNFNQERFWNKVDSWR